MGIGKALLVAATAAAFTASSAAAQTTTSPAGGALPSGVSVIGGVVTDLIGLNGNRVVSQLAASSLYEGYANTNPLTIGTQTGFDAAVLAALGGGISEAAFRFSLYDGDSAPGDFDDGTDNTLLVNGLDFGLWSNVATTVTNSSGTVFGSAAGFPDNQLASGFFYSNSASLLSGLYSSLTGSNSLMFAVNDADPYDNFYDFTQGIDSELIDVGSGPVVQPPTGVVPEPMSMALLGTGLAGLGAVRRRRKKDADAV